MMSPTEPSHPTTASLENDNTAEAQEKDIKTNLVRKWINPLRNVKKAKKNTNS